MPRPSLVRSFATFAVALLAGCSGADNAPPPVYPPSGQWTPPPAAAPGPWGQRPAAPQASYTAPGQWVPPPAAQPAPWWQPPAGGLQLPSWPALPALPAGFQLPQGFPWPPGTPASPGTPATPSAPATGGVAQSCVDGINQYRATLGVAPLARWTPNESCVDGESRDDSVTGRAHASFGRCGEMAQNACPGWPGPPEKMIGPCLDAMWKEGPGPEGAAHGHYINMSNASYTKVACGQFVMPTGDVWAVQYFQ